METHPTLALTRHVALSKRPNLSEPRSLHLSGGMNDPCLADHMLMCAQKTSISG